MGIERLRRLKRQHNMKEMKTSPELLLRVQMHERQQNLQAIAAQLKTELIGIDDVIDRVTGAVRAWYVMPQLITRPVIVCLWGLTGTGKTQLTRRLAQLLGFYDRFVEVQMDGFSQNGDSYGASTISGTLESAGLVEGAPGILVLDEFQRYRTVSSRGEDSKVERYQDVWALLSDGKLPPALSELHSIERKLADALYDAERAEEDDAQERRKKQKMRYKIDAWDAQALKRSLKLDAPLLDIMQWSNDYIHSCWSSFVALSNPGRPITASCWSLSVATSMRCTRRRPAASRTATPMPTSSTGSPAACR